VLVEHAEAQRGALHRRGRAVQLGRRAHEDTDLVGEHAVADPLVLHQEPTDPVNPVNPVNPVKKPSPPIL
jgi:hypothetical protein